jgi:hypothetical protein
MDKIVVLQIFLLLAVALEEIMGIQQELQGFLGEVVVVVDSVKQLHQH